jgi:hypothetical protein
VIDANFEIGRCTSGRSAGLASGQVTVADLRKLIDDGQEIVISRQTKQLMSIANIIDEMMDGAEVVIRRRLGSIIAGQ